jgi:hypothetical protein
MKVAVIGAGSSYTPELINGFLDRVDEFPMTKLRLMDVPPERLEIVGGFAQRMVEARGAPFRVVLTTDQRHAVAGRRRRLRDDADPRRLDGSASRRRISRSGPRVDWSGDNGRRWHGQGPAHDSLAALYCPGHGGPGVRRAPGQPHQSGRSESTARRCGRASFRPMLMNCGPQKSRPGRPIWSST